MILIIAKTLIILGLFFFFGTSVGLIRFPDFYTRMHAAGKGDTLSTVLLLLGIALYMLEYHHWHGPIVLAAVKLLFIAIFIFVGSPTATHAIMAAGFKTGAAHWTQSKKDLNK